MSKRRRVDEIGEFIKDNAPVDKKEVITKFAKEFEKGHDTIRKYLEELREEDVFFESPKGKCVTDRWPPDEGDPTPEYGKWRRLHLEYHT